MKGWKKKIWGCFLAAILAIMSTAPCAMAHPQITTSAITLLDGWEFHYTDGSTSKGGYFHIRENGEHLFCVEPHMDNVGATRIEWVTLEQYFHDAAFARKLSLIAYFGENSGWGLNGWAAAQSLIWKYIMERDGETGEQWISTDTITTREQMQVYYDVIEQAVRDFDTVPSFHNQNITLQAGQSTVVTDSNGVLSGMKVESSGSIQVSKNGNDLTITALGTDAGTGRVILEKELPNGTKGETFVYTVEEYQDLMVYGAYEPVWSSLNVVITEKPVTMQISKQDITTGRELPGAAMKVTDRNGNVVDAWTSGTEPHMLCNLKNGEKYTLTETIPAPGYATAQNIVFTAAHGADPVVMKDDITKIQISKTDLTTGKELPGAGLRVTDSKGKAVDQWVSGTTPHMITKLVAGETYRLEETKPAPGYVTAQSVSFTVKDTGDVQKVQMKDDITKVEISKTDLTTGKELPGASLQVADSKGKVVDQWISGEKPHSITGLTAGETYVLTEVLPAPGYVTAESVTFTVNDTDKLQKIKMEDDVTKVDIFKTDITNGEELPGASLQISDAEGNVIDEWISGEEPHRMEKLVAGETYTLTETHPANGYVTAETISFTVEDTGEVQKVEMKDDITKTEISKLDTADGKSLTGAILQILDKEGETVCEWVSEEEPRLVEKLTVGETYILHEKEAPEGYLTAEDVEFTVSDTGEVQTVAIEDELAVINLEVAKRTINRTQTGDTYQYTITTLRNASNTELENFTCTDYLPEQVLIQELHTGTFSDELEYDIAYQTNYSEEWRTLAWDLNSTENHILNFGSIPLEEGEQITAYRYEFGTAPEGFQIAGQNPVYFTTVKQGVDVTDEMLTNITLSGDWRGVSVTDKDDTVTLLFEGKIEPLKSFGRVLTGDASPLTYFILLTAVSAGVLVILFIKRRKIFHNQKDRLID